MSCLLKINLTFDIFSSFFYNMLSFNYDTKIIWKIYYFYNFDVTFNSSNFVQNYCHNFFLLNKQLAELMQTNFRNFFYHLQFFSPQTIRNFSPQRYIKNSKKLHMITTTFVDNNNKKKSIKPEKRAVINKWSREAPPPSTSSRRAITLLNIHKFITRKSDPLIFSSRNHTGRLGRKGMF